MLPSLGDASVRQEAVRQRGGAKDGMRRAWSQGLGFGTEAHGDTLDNLGVAEVS
jgi:hypothetical protein